MKAIIPAAGQGTRLYPQTHTKPKAMVRLAGKPILGHILGSIAETAVDDVVIVVGGPMQDQIIEYSRNAFSDRFEFEFVEQANAEGLGHSIYQAESVARGEPLLIALGDMLFENGYETFLNAHEDLGAPDASVGVKEVEEPQHYGVVELHDGIVTRLVEKPDDPPSNYAISGVYIIEDSDALFDSLEHLIENDLRGAGGEYHLTDALQRMVDSDAQVRVFEVDDWYDCGRPKTLLEANRVLLTNSDVDRPDSLENVVVVPPVDFGDNVSAERSVIGPYVSVGDGATLSNSIVRNSIVGGKASLNSVNLDESIVGEHTKVEGESNQLNIGDNNTINL